MDIDIPGYKLLRTLGKGGMATVYLAQQEIFEREVAIKVMSKTLAEDPSFGQRFFREAKIVSQLMHPNIVTVHDAGVHKGSYYLSMEYIDGHDLKYLRKKLTLAQKISVVKDIARALDYAGSKGFVHRDIKPENIMFRTGDNSAVLTDFGIARAVKTDLAVTQTGTAIGTPHYMSPEQAKGKSVDHRSDLYSLGVVFYQLLTGRVPYDGESAVAIGIKHITEPLPKLPGSLSQLQPLLNGLLAKSPDDRYQRGGEFLQDLDEIDMSILRPAPEGSGATVQDPSQDTDVTEIDTERFTLVFDTEESLPKGTGSFWSGFFAVSFILLAVTTIVYISRPKVLEPWIETAEEFVGRHYARANEAWQKRRAESAEPQQSTSARSQPEAAAPIVLPTPDVIEEIEESSDQPAEEQADEPQAVVDESRVEGSLVLESEPAATPDPQVEAEREQELRIASLREELAKLGEAAERDPTYVASWIDAHYRLLAESPFDSDVRDSLSRIQRTMAEDVLDLAYEGKQALTEKRLSSFKQLFPDYSTQDFNELDLSAKRYLNIHVLLEKGRSEIEQRRLYEPEGENALETFKNIQLISPQDKRPGEHLAHITNLLIEIAEQKMGAGDWQGANEVMAYALEATPGHARAMEVEARASRELMRRRDLQEALNLAQEYQSKGQLYSPLYANAYDQYVKVLKLEPGHAKAELALTELVDALSQKVWALVGEEKFSEAQATLERPLLLLDGNQRISSLSQAVEEVVQNRSNSAAN
jgi:serine/threonine protein kinase/tetratricopeptide (TPR) repeat protein